MKPLALLTRPKRDSEELANLLKLIGVNSLIEPLIEICNIKDVTLPSLESVQALVMTSANGVRSLTNLLGDSSILTSELKLFAVGSITADIARKHGFQNVEHAGGNINSLASLITERASPNLGPLLHIAGTEVAGDLATLLSQKGFIINRECIYRVETSKALSKDTANELASGKVNMVLFFSPRTAKAFTDLFLEKNINNNLSQLVLKSVTAICLSSNVALEASRVNWRRIRVARRPERSAILNEVILETKVKGSNN